MVSWMLRPDRCLHQARDQCTAAHYQRPTGAVPRGGCAGSSSRTSAGSTCCSSCHPACREGPGGQGLCSAGAEGRHPQGHTCSGSALTGALGLGGISEWHPARNILQNRLVRVIWVISSREQAGGCTMQQAGTESASCAASTCAFSSVEASSAVFCRKVSCATAVAIRAAGENAECMHQTMGIESIPRGQNQLRG